MINYLRRQSGYPAVRRAAVAGTIVIPPGIPAMPTPPSQPDALGSERGIYVRLPGGNYFPPGAQPVDEMGDANIPAGGTGLLLTVPLAAQQRFRVAGLGFTADDETALAFLTWTIFLGPDPLPGYINKSAAVGTVAQLAGMDVVVGSSLPLTIVGTTSLIAVVTYRFIARIRGWLYAEMGAF